MIQVPVSKNALACVMMFSLLEREHRYDDTLDAIRYFLGSGKLKIHRRCQLDLDRFKQYKYEKEIA